jgi:hypothetical protein
MWVLKGVTVMKTLEQATPDLLEDSDFMAELWNCYCELKKPTDELRAQIESTGSTVEALRKEAMRHLYECHRELAHRFAEQEVWEYASSNYAVAMRCRDLMENNHA